MVCESFTISTVYELFTEAMYVWACGCLFSLQRFAVNPRAFIVQATSGVITALRGVFRAFAYATQLTDADNNNDIAAITGFVNCECWWDHPQCCFSIRATAPIHGAHRERDLLAAGASSVASIVGGIHGRPQPHSSACFAFLCLHSACWCGSCHR